MAYSVGNDVVGIRPERISAQTTTEIECVWISRQTTQVTLVRKQTEITVGMTVKEQGRKQVNLVNKRSERENFR